MLCAGLLTPHKPRPKVSSSIRSDVSPLLIYSYSSKLPKPEAKRRPGGQTPVRGQETRAQLSCHYSTMCGVS